MTAGFATLIIVLGSLGHWTEEAFATSSLAEPGSSPNTLVASSNAPSVRSISASNMSPQASVSISSSGMNSTESNIIISTSFTDSTATQGLISSYNSKSTGSATNTAITSSAVNSPASSSTSKPESTFSARISTSSVTQRSTISASFTARSTSNTTQPDSIALSSKTLSSSESSASKASSTPNETNLARSSRTPTQPEASQTSIAATSLASHVALGSSKSVVSSSKTLSSVANTLPSLAFQVSFHVTGSSFVQTMEKVPSESPATESSNINESASSTPTATIYTHSSVILLTSEGVLTSPIPPIPRLTSSLPSLEASFLISPLAGSITSATPSSTPSSASTPASQTPSSGPTIPQEGTKTVIIEVSLDMKFLNEYNNINSPAYKNLETELKTNLTKVYKHVDGFVDVRILLITEGSVICNYVVILAKNSAVTEDKLKDILLNAGKETFPFKVQSVTLVRTEKPPNETLPHWALVTMIVLGVLAFVFIVVAICACVKYRKYKEPYYLSSGEIDMQSFEAVGYGNMRAKVDVNASTAQRRLVASHTNPAYGTKGNLDD
ncbi:uncharacterized protein [Montipora capricornis]|uniref:uncharacterized protein n=1 Tax=Montipora capricornis TaxID=246305 RepID=UPI0035F21669